MAEEKDLTEYIKGKDREYFQERGYPYPLFWYGLGEVPPSGRKKSPYSAEMRKISDYTIEQVEFIEMFWGLIKLDTAKLEEAGKDEHMTEFIKNIPVPTPTRINALLQTRLSMISPEERREWADRVEGKSVSREVSMSLTTTDEDNTTSATRDFIKSQFDKLGDAWDSYGKDLKEEELNYTAVKSLEAPKEDDGEVQG